jgi:hypothetical protein
LAGAGGGVGGGGLPGERTARHSSSDFWTGNAIALELLLDDVLKSELRKGNGMDGFWLGRMMIRPCGLCARRALRMGRGWRRESGIIACPPYALAFISLSLKKIPIYRLT